MFNVVRPITPPASLANQSKHDGEDVLLSLKQIFYDKCYLCEAKNPHDINVEHFRPHEGVVTLKFDWNNLFYACSRCNNIKSNDFKDILDCTDVTVDVFRKIKLLPPRTPNAKLEVTAMDTEASTVSTVKLLEKIYNDPTTINKKITGAYLRKEVFQKYNRLIEIMTSYLSDESSPTKKTEELDKLKTLMGKHQEFSGFLRWLILDDPDLRTLLEPHMD